MRAKKIEELEKRSVLKWVTDLPPNVPILLLHGTNDKRVSVNHSIDLAAALSKKTIFIINLFYTQTIIMV